MIGGEETGDGNDLGSLVERVSPLPLDSVRPRPAGNEFPIPTVFDSTRLLCSARWNGGV